MWADKYLYMGTITLLLGITWYLSRAGLVSWKYILPLLMILLGVIIVVKGLIGGKSG